MILSKMFPPYLQLRIEYNRITFYCTSSERLNPWQSLDYIMQNASQIGIVFSNITKRGCFYQPLLKG
ncbi:hypothetical protein GCM10007425_18300 [Lysinibacillus alkalisoli]|uniref:Uncharacterized protein n=1 Tax=Lysinibacillus alkalisoli TaxID=1911548 RepID=A0A917G6E3_9BACI|nr:hypothetical protein GCM10007425_18300 [Lysinibacillus alkalisoli]